MKNCLFKVGKHYFLKKLGNGTFGDVYLTTKDYNSYFATKKIDAEKLKDPRVFKYLQSEIEILNLLKGHPNIYRFEEAIKSVDNNYYIVLEFVNGGSLQDCLDNYIKKFGTPFSEEIVQYLMRQIINGVKYIHEKKIIHRDLKLENIMINYDNDIDKNNFNLLKARVKIIDFGVSIRNNLGQTAIGSLFTMDPFILNKYYHSAVYKMSKKDSYDDKVDIWSLGVIFYQMLTGENSVFEAGSGYELLKAIEKGNYHVPTTVSKEAVSFLLGMLQYQSNKRLNFDELLRHQFLTKNVRDFQKLDTRKLINKIDEKGVQINIKRNKTILGIVNEGNNPQFKNNPRGTPLKRANTFSENTFSIYSKLPPKNPYNPINNKNPNIYYTQNMINSNNLINQMGIQPSGIGINNPSIPYFPINNTQGIQNNNTYTPNNYYNPINNIEKDDDDTKKCCIM